MTRSMALGTFISWAHRRATYCQPSCRAAAAGNSAFRSCVVVKYAAAMSSTSTSFDSTIAVSNSTVASSMACWCCHRRSSRRECLVSLPWVLLRKKLKVVRRKWCRKQDQEMPLSPFTKSTAACTFPVGWGVFDSVKPWRWRRWPRRRRSQWRRICSLLDTPNPWMTGTSVWRLTRPTRSATSVRIF